MNLVSIIGKSLQTHARQNRGWLRRRHSRTIYQRWLQSFSVPPSFHKTCLVDVRQIVFDGPQGRRFHALIMFLRAEGYRIWIVPHLNFLQTGLKPFKWNALLQCEPYDRTVADRTGVPGRFDLCLSDTCHDDPRATQTVRLTHHSHRCLHDNELALPFAHHPDLVDGGEMTRLHLYRMMDRRWQVFFGGSRVAEDYRSISFFKYLPTVNRHRLLELCLDHFVDEVTRPRDSQHFVQLLHRDCKGFVFADSGDYRIPPKQWMTSIATSTFFVAAPGSRYPMSHNCIEALSVGTIPILEYGGLFQPRLRDGVDCLTYRGEAGFTNALRRAQSMSPETIAAIRQGAIDYFDRHLSSRALIEKIEHASSAKLHVFPYLTRPAA